MRQGMLVSILPFVAAISSAVAQAAGRAAQGGERLGTGLAGG